MGARFLRPRRRAAQQGQALVEFAVILALLMVITVTTLSMVPAITARGTVLSAASTAVERSNSYLAPAGMSFAAQKNTLCNQILAVVRQQLRAAKAPVAGTATDGCRTGVPDNAYNPVVSVTTDAGVSSLVVRPGPGQNITMTVCVSYRYDFGAGLIWLASNGPGDIGATTKKLFTYKFCGRSILDANRTR